MIASSPTPRRHRVSSLETAEPAAPGTLEIEELPVEPAPALPPPGETFLIEIDRAHLAELAVRRGLGRFLAGFPRRR
ncbi:MAG TPA: hypothetical protein VM734_04635 [Kofleriaceae bacterium]|nr:hypothetical protein [Kofleriaceae bacterium]